MRGPKFLNLIIGLALSALVVGGIAMAVDNGKVRVHSAGQAVEMAKAAAGPIITFEAKSWAWVPHPTDMYLPGKCDKTSVLAYVQWLNSGLPKNIQVVQNDTGANGGFTGTGSAILKDFALTGERGDYQEVTLSIVPNGPFVWTANA